MFQPPLLRTRCAGNVCFVHTTAAMHTFFLLLLLPLLLVSPAHLFAADEVRIPITRDTWVSAYRGETDGNNGSDGRLKTKGIVELSIVDFDASPLQGQSIRRAWLYLKPASSDKQLRLTVSSLSSDWTAGHGSRYSKIKGTASFNWAQQDVTPWAWPGSDVTAVIAGQGNSLWGFADADAPNVSGYQRVAVDPRVIAARIAGLSYGMAIIDDVGSEYTRQGDNFSYQQFPNRFLYSNDASSSNRPYLVIEPGAHDGLPPGPVSDLKTSFDNLPQGQCQLTWTVPIDHGAANTMGFIVSIKLQPEDQSQDDNTNTPAYVRSDEKELTIATRVPPWLVPLATKPGEQITTTLHDLPVDFTKPVALYIRAVDSAGNAGAITRYNIPARTTPVPKLELPLPPTPFNDTGTLPTLQNAGEVFVVDTLDKIHPRTGQMIPSQLPGYQRGNHLWSAEKQQVRLFGARSEFVSFQFVVQGDKFPQAVVLMNDEHIKATVSRMAYIPMENGPLPDPVIPLDAKEPHPVFNQRYHSGIVELYIPPDTKPGQHQGSLLLSAGGQTLTLNIDLKVWNFKLPDHLSFVPQMNAYGLGRGSTELDYYRLAQLHRTCLNRLPYNWQGRVQPGGAPQGDPTNFNWSDWDKRFGPLFDGSAFADLPRGKIPVEHFYLPLNENWPASIDEGFTKGNWADEALTPAYRQQFINGSRQFAAHLHDKQWNSTFFEFFLNGKIIFKRNKWSNASSPWIFDEPVATQDFWALRWYGRAFHEAVNLERKAGNGQEEAFPKLVFRADVSRPQWQRDTLDGVMDINVVGGPFVQYQRYVNQRKRANQEMLVQYGSTGPITKPATQPAAWCIDAWLREGDGVLPWQTMGKSSSWDKEDSQALFYPGGPAGLEHPLPSIRLKAYRMGQQTTEYLTILSKTQGLPRWALDEAVREMALLEQPDITQHGEAAADIDFTRVKPQSLWRLNTALGMMIDQLAPADKDRWIDLRTPARQPKLLPERLVE